MLQLDQQNPSSYPHYLTAHVVTDEWWCGQAKIAEFAISHNASFTHVSPTTYQITADGSLQPWSENDEAFASQFLAHGLRVLPLIWVRDQRSSFTFVQLVALHMV